MLAGVDQTLGRAAPGECGDHRGGLDEIGPGTDDVRDRTWCHGVIVSQPDAPDGAVIVQRRRVVVAALFSMDPAGRYFYDRGCNTRALVAVAIAAVFSVAAVWVPALTSLSGFAWVIGALLGALLYIVAMGGRSARAVDSQPMA